MLNIERYQKNLAVIASFKESKACPDLLKKYSGWGGLKKELSSPAVYKELQKSLTPEEISSLKQTVTSAYYTPSELVKFIYGWLQVYGFTGGDILEPSIGHGVFMEHIPQEIRDHSRITALDIDPISSRIVKKLYPDVNLYRQGFETWNTAQRFDLVIGNPPYGSQILTDEHHSDLKSFFVHHYFAAKGIRLLKEGGILAMVLPSSFLDNVKDHVRHIIDKEGGGLLAAYRLPDDLFSDAKVSIDLVFLKKGKTGKKWVSTRGIKIGGLSKPLNEYFHTHSHNILGNLEIVDMYERKGLTCRKRGDPFQLLRNVLKTMKQAKLVKLMQEISDMEQREKALHAYKIGLRAQCRVLSLPENSF